MVDPPRFAPRSATADPVQASRSHHLETYRGRAKLFKVSKLSEKASLFFSPSLGDSLAIHIPNLQFTNPVSRDKVHKLDASGVFPTEVVAIGADELWAGVRWPVTHAFYRRHTSQLDSYLLIETIRQLTILVCHDHYGTPLGSHFVMPGIGASLALSWGGDLGAVSEIAVHLRGTNVRRTTAGALQSVELEAAFYADGMIIATGHGDAMIVNDRVYARMRGGRTEKFQGGPARQARSTFAPQSVGHKSTADVVLARSSTVDRFTLSLDLNNSILFDHPLDHVAGMIAVEAARQIMRVSFEAPEAEMGGAEFHFDAALEFGEDITVSVTRTKTEFRLAFIQGGRVAVRAEVTAVLTSASVPGRESGGLRARERLPAGPLESPREG